MPVGAYGGRRDIMQMVAPSGPVYQAGNAYFDTPLPIGNYMIAHRMPFY